MKEKLVIIFVFVYCGLFSIAQDRHFSQFYSAPLTMNPGNTGVFNGDIRAYTLYRMQWFTVTTPYKTFSLALDAPVFKKKMRGKNFFSAGINFDNDNQGAVNLRTNSFNALFSFTKYLGGRQKHNITLGYEIGYTTKSAGLGSLTYDSQWDGTNYNPAFGSAEPAGGGIGFMDMSTGLVWNFVTDHLFRSALGFSFHHFTAPNNSIAGGSDRLLPKLGVQWLVNKKLSEGSNTTLEPSIMASQQGSLLLINVGTSVKYILSEASKYTDNQKDKAVHLGVYYRYRDAVFVTFRMDYADFSGSLAYDINLSGLTPVSKSVGGFELMIAYRGVFGNQKNAKRASRRFLS